MNKYSCKIVVSSLMFLISAIMARADLSYSNAVMTLNPVAYWPLEETNQLPNSVATNLGTAGATYNGNYTGGVIPGATGALVGDTDTSASFIATGDMVVPFGSALSNNAPFSAEVWALAGNNSAGAGVVSDGEFGSPRSGWIIYNNVGGVWTFRLYNQNGTTPSLSISGGVADSNWHHIVAVYDGTNGSLYIDGALAAGPTAAAYVPNVDAPLTIGGRSDGSFPYNGSIDEVAIYTNALSSAVVSAHYLNGTSATPVPTYSSLVLASNPEFYYRLNGTPSTAIATNYGSIGATVNGAYRFGSQPAVAGPNGKGFGPSSYACSFNPTAGGHVDCTTDASLDITGPITVVAWVKGAPADTSRFQSFLGRSDSSWRADLGPENTDRWADGSNPDCVGQTLVNDGNWHFFAGVYDGSANNFVYIDGAPDATNAASGSPGGDPTARMLIGGVGDYIPSRLFKGSVAQVAVFTSALTAAQIQTLYLAGELAPTITQQPQGITNGLGSSVSLAVAVTGNPGFVYQWYQGTTKLGDVAGNISGSTTGTLTLTNAQVANSGNYTVVVTNNYGSVTSAVAVVSITPSPDIVSQPPSNTVVYAGNQLTFSVTVVGATPLSYRWYKGTSPIGGATGSNVTFTAVAGTNNYFCIVTNSYGSATSSVARVAAQTFVLPAGGFAVNFDAYDGTPADNFVGQGAYSDPGNNTWNPIGGSGATTGLALSSATNQTLVTATAIYGFPNSGIGLGTQVNGDPSWLLSTEYAVNSGAPGIGTSGAPKGQVTINGLPQGTYTVYLYGQNYDGDRGSIFSFAATNGGVADQGMDATDPAAQSGFTSTDGTTFVEGQTYVFFTNVVADATGAIRLFYVYNDRDPLLLTGEAPFDGVQVVATSIVTPPTTMALQLSGGSAIVSWVPGGGTLQVSTNIIGTYTNITGATSPYTNPITAPKLFFRVKVQ